MNIYCILGQFTVPSVSGQCCPATSSFTINKINQNKGIMLGGTVTDDDGLAIATNNVYIFNVTHNTIVSYYYYDSHEIIKSHKTDSTMTISKVLRKVILSVTDILCSRIF